MRDEAPTCFIEKHKSALRVVTVNPAALALGLEPGLTLADARARVPRLVAVNMDRTADRTWLERIADFCDRYTPMVALNSADSLVLDITGCDHLFGGEQALREALLSRLSRIATEVSASIAGTPQAARALARFRPPGQIVATGTEAEAVAPLPVAALDVDRETVVALRRAGLATIGDLKDRPRAPLTARFGSGLIDRLACVLGERNIGMVPRRPLSPCSAERRFAEPITQVADALATLQQLAGRLARSLEARGEGGRRFEAALFRTDFAVSRLAVETAKPVREPDTLIRLFRERIDTLRDPLDPGFGYDLIRLSVTVSGPFQTTQHSLDGRAGDADDVTALIDRLSTRFGRDAVLRLAPVATHIPERSVKMLPAGLADAAGQADWQNPTAEDSLRRPILLFARPQPIEALAEVPDGPPLRFRWRRVLHEIARAEGPERIAPEWWRSQEPSPTRDYYCVEDVKGHRFWVFREGLYQDADRHPHWFLHGLFA